MKLKHTVFTLSLLAATAIAVTGCDRGANVIDFAGNDLTSPSEAVSPTDASGSDTVVPEDAGTTPDPVTPPTSNPTDPTDPSDPTGPLNVCSATNPPPCIIVDPAPGTGGPLDHVHGDLSNFVDVEPVHDNSDGGYQEPDAGCSHFQSPTGGRRMKQNIGTVNDTDAIIGANDCVML